MERQNYLAMKFGGPEGAKNVYDRIRSVGAEDGIDFAFEDIARTPNTVDSHRLIRWAAGQERENEVVEELFQSYFFKGEDIGSTDVLAAAAEKAGMDPEEARAFLESEALEAEIREEDRQARGLGHGGIVGQALPLCRAVGRQDIGETESLGRLHPVQSGAVHGLRNPVVRAAFQGIGHGQGRDSAGRVLQRGDDI
jgi:protein-disulfide isomerase-like protein with CxxC motif